MVALHGDALSHLQLEVSGGKLFEDLRPPGPRGLRSGIAAVGGPPGPEGKRLSRSRARRLGKAERRPPWPRGQAETALDPQSSPGRKSSSLGSGRN